MSFLLTNNVVEGASYMFIAKAINSWGQADFWSPATTILAATAPGQTTSVRSEIDPATGGIAVSWTATDDRGSIITSY